MKELKLLPLLLAIVLLAACSKTVMQNETAADQQPEPAVQAQPEPQERAAAAEPLAVHVFSGSRRPADRGLLAGPLG